MACQVTARGELVAQRLILEPMLSKQKSWLFVCLIQAKIKPCPTLQLYTSFSDRK